MAMDKNPSAWLKMQCVDQEHHLVALLEAALYSEAHIQMPFSYLWLYPRELDRFLIDY